MYYNTSYLEENDTDINLDLIFRKEFQLFKKNIDYINKRKRDDDYDLKNNIIPKFVIDELHRHNDYLELHSYQLFTQNYFNPDTPYNRLLLKWETGTGKTIGAISIALNFIDYYRKEEDYNRIINNKYSSYAIQENTSKEIGSVFIIGFTQHIFKNELLKYPEFGFISRKELKELNRIKQLAFAGDSIATEKLKNFTAHIRKRLSDRNKNGFFKFIGYKELTNHLFIRKNVSKILKEINDKKEITDEKEISRINKLSSENLNLFSLTEAELKDYISKGYISLNMDLLNQFSNSLIICDEIHNVYNTTEKNNWGVSIQTILNYHTSCRALFLSATPVNNSPTEIIDLLNLLLPRKLYPVLKKDQFFTKTGELIEDKREILASFFKGRVSFIRNTNPLYFATKKINGEKIPSIDYLNFIRCPMSPFQYNTYTYIRNTGEQINETEGDTSNESADDEKASKETADDEKAIKETEDDERENKKVAKRGKKLGIDEIYLSDFVLPNPDIAISKNPYNYTGIFRTTDIKNKLDNVSQEWKNKISIYYDNDTELLKGNLLMKKNIYNISTKYYRMIEKIQKNISEKRGKIFIYHNIIHMSGTLFIQEILLKNNILDEFGSPSDETLCSICGKVKKAHSKNQLLNISQREESAGNFIPENMEFEDDTTVISEYVGAAAVKPKKNAPATNKLTINKNLDKIDHYFKPVRFIIIHSNLDKKTINRSMEKFNDKNKHRRIKFYDYYRK